MTCAGWQKSALNLQGGNSGPGLSKVAFGQGDFAHEGNTLVSEN